MIYVITAIHNRYEITHKFVEQLLAQTYKDIQLVLVDDGSTDGTADMVKKLMPNAIIIHGDGNLWWGGALHEAYKWIKKNAECNAFIMFANDDSTFPNDYIERALCILSSEEKMLLAGAGYDPNTEMQVDGAIIHDFKTALNDLSLTGRGNCASTRSLFFRVKDFMEIGGFHPVLLPHYASDYEWTTRACVRHGYQVYCDTTLKYYVSPETTGDNTYEGLSIRKIFSKRAIINPIYRMNYIVLVTPAKYLILALFSQWKRYMINIRGKKVHNTNFKLRE